MYHLFAETEFGDSTKADCEPSCAILQCKDECHSETQHGITGSICICKTNLCNRSSILSVNYSIIGILVLFHFLK